MSPDWALCQPCEAGDHLECEAALYLGGVMVACSCHECEEEWVSCEHRPVVEVVYRPRATRFCHYGKSNRNRGPHSY